MTGSPGTRVRWIGLVVAEPVKAFETSAHDYFCTSVSMVGLLTHAAVGSSGGLGLRFEPAWV
jgi:hypothetical protein